MNSLNIIDRITTSPLSARKKLIKLLGDLVGASKGLSYSIVMRGGKPYSVEHVTFGPEPFLEYFKKEEGTCML
ncbi:MAG: hypothetical protein JXR95_02095 [Deltaproteobacteria bacterium]|nr:hypothetical protein [Deltaproteobacteria bacterium]